MEFPDYLDTRDLETLAGIAFETVTSTEEDISDEDVAEAQTTLDAMKAALRDFGYDAEDSEVAESWKEIGDNIHVTLVKEDSLGEYWEEKSVDYGLFTKEQVEFLGEAVDWEMIARNQDGVQGTFLYKGDEITYFIY